MKLQFATFEAAISLLVALTATALASRVAVNINRSVHTSQLSMSESMAIFDIENELLKNASAQECVLKMANSTSCAQSLLRFYQSVYGLHLEIASQGVYVGEVNQSVATCFSIANQTICIAVGE